MEEFNKDETPNVVGTFDLSLKRNNKQIRDDRATSISRKTKKKYKLLIDDMEDEVLDLETDMENMLDLSPTNTQSLALAVDFNSTEYSSNDLEIAMKIRNLKIKIEVGKARYKRLFGEEL